MQRAGHTVQVRQSRHLYLPEPGRAAATIRRISYQGVTESSHMNAELVLTTSHRVQPYQAEAGGESLKDLVIG